MTDEEWRPIAGYEGLYEVSNLGRVKRLAGVVARTRGGRFQGKVGPFSVQEKILAFHVNYAGGRQGGRLMATLTKNGKGRQFLVHRLVALAFIPNPENLSDATHIDHNPLNNAVSNLEWLSHRQNIRDSVHAGRWRKKLSEDMVREIQRRAATGESQVSIAKELDIAYGTVNSIATGRSWRHIDNGTEFSTIITESLIREIAAAVAAGKSPAEILATLPRKRKPKKSV